MMNLGPATFLFVVIGLFGKLSWGLYISSRYILIYLLYYLWANFDGLFNLKIGYKIEC